MKTKYIKPSVEVIKIEMTPFMAGSGGEVGYDENMDDEGVDGGASLSKRYDNYNVWER